MGRNTLKDWEWVSIKDAVDVARAGYPDDGTICLLQDFSLWDNHFHELDEEAVTKLYMENC